MCIFSVCPLRHPLLTGRHVLGELSAEFVTQVGPALSDGIARGPDGRFGAVWDLILPPVHPLAVAPRESVLSFAGHDDELAKTVRQYREKYKGISVALDHVPEILDAVHQDLLQLTEGNRRQGRKADFTSETVLRVLIVMMVEGLAYRETVIRIAESEFRQDFIRTRKKAVMDHTCVNKCFKAIRPATWKRVNELLAAHAVQEGYVQPNVIRTDTTVVECNIHWPTDSSLLWDTWRVASRVLRRARDLDASLVPHRCDDRKIKRLPLTVTRYSASTSQKRQRFVKQSHHTLIARVTWMVGIVEQFCVVASRSRSVTVMALGSKLADYLPSMVSVASEA